jgi:molecular chaperone HscB
VHGIDLAREEAGHQKNMPHAFLEEVMELREGLHVYVERKDLASAQAMARDVTQRKQRSMETAVKALTLLEDDALAPEARKTALHDASVELGRVRYYQRFLEEVEAMEEEAL